MKDFRCKRKREREICIYQADIYTAIDLQAFLHTLYSKFLMKDQFSPQGMEDNLNLTLPIPISHYVNSQIRELSGNASVYTLPAPPRHTHHHSGTFTRGDSLFVLQLGCSMRDGEERATGNSTQERAHTQHL